jgi:hypothetical protein
MSMIVGIVGFGSKAKRPAERQARFVSFVVRYNYQLAHRFDFQSVIFTLNTLHAAPHPEGEKLEDYKETHSEPS